MIPVKCPNCRLSLPQNWTGTSDPNAKCPYCGKPLAGKPAGTTPASPAETPAPPPQQPAGRPGGGAKTILWGVGAQIPGLPVKPARDAVAAPVPEASTRPLGAPMPGASSRPAEPAPMVASDPALRQAFAEAADGLSTAPTVSRNVAEVPPSAGTAWPAPSAAADSPSVDVDVAESFDPPAAIAKSAPTVMFERESPAAASVANRVPSAADFIASAPDPSDQGEEDESAPNEEPGPREEEPKGRPAARKGRRRSPAPQKWGSMGAEVEDDAPEAPPSSKRTIIIVVAAVASAAVVLAAVALLRGGKKAEEPLTGQMPASAQPASAEPAKAEPATNEELPAPAAKPAPAPAKPAELAKPAVAEPPTPSEKAGRADRPGDAKPGRAEKPERPERVATEAKVPSEKGKPAASAPPPASPEPKSGAKAPNEADYQRANDAYQRGNAKLFKGDTGGAIADFNLALRLNPKDPTIHRGLGLAYAQAGNSADAVKHLKAYLKGAPKANDRATIQKRIDQLRGK